MEIANEIWSLFIAFVEEKAVFIRERINNHYSPGSYVVANTIASIPFVFVIALVSSILIETMVRSRSTFEHFVIYTLNLFTALMVSESMMLMISAVSPVFMIGLAGGACFLGLYMCTVMFLFADFMLFFFWISFCCDFYLLDFFWYVVWILFDAE